MTRRESAYAVLPYGNARQAVYIVCRHTMGPLIGFGGETRCGPKSALRISLMLAVAASSFSIERVRCADGEGACVSREGDALGHLEGTKELLGGGLVHHREDRG